MRYRDVAAAVDWLCTAFGFQRQTVVTGEGGATVYAQLTFGRAMLMLAQVRATPLDKFMKQPDEIGGAETQSCYLVVSDADAHHARAKGAGAEIILDLQDDDFGGRGYTCRDPEGHIWTFGTYDPWQGKHPQPAATTVRGGMRRVVLAGLATTMIASAVAAAWIGGVLTQPGAVSSTAQVQEPAVPEKAAAEAKQRAAEEQASRELRTQLDRERAARATADKASEDALKRLAEEQRAREAAERAGREARGQLERERAAGLTADKANAGALEQRLAEEKSAREAAEQAVREAREQLERERAAKVAAEMAKDFALSRADEERLAREAAERAVQEAREGGVVKAPAAEADALKGAAEVQRALEQAQKRAAEAQRAREAAERAAQEAREQLAREQIAKNAAWKTAAQLRRQLSQVQGNAPPGEASNAGDDDGPAPALKKARPRLKQKKAAEPDE